MHIFQRISKEKSPNRSDFTLHPNWRRKSTLMARRMGVKKDSTYAYITFCLYILEFQFPEIVLRLTYIPDGIFTSEAFFRKCVIYSGSNVCVFCGHQNCVSARGDSLIINSIFWAKSSHIPYSSSKNVFKFQSQIHSRIFPPLHYG